MKIAVWKTGHQIADTVAESLVEGLNGTIYNTSEDSKQIIQSFGDELLINVGYGILRGTADVFKQSDHWFNVDRGYFNPRHFDGYYRISYKGTQAKWHEGIPEADIDFELEPWKDNEFGYCLICPPTDAVCDFFGIKDWIGANRTLIERQHALGYKLAVRVKGDSQPIDWNKIASVITFNSSIGWQALQKGIACISDPDHSIVGSYYQKKGIDFLSGSAMADIAEVAREPLFRCMKAHQFTLAEIRKGNAWRLLNYYLQKQTINTKLNHQMIEAL